MDLLPLPEHRGDGNYIRRGGLGSNQYEIKPSIRSLSAGHFARRQLVQAEHDMAHHKEQALAQEREARIDRQKHRQAWTEANDARVFLGLPLLPSSELEF